MNKALAALGILATGTLTALAVREVFRDTSPEDSPPPRLYEGSTPVIPLVSCSITPHDVESVISQLDELKGRPVGLMIHTHGGYFQPVMQIARAVQQHGKVHAIVPYYALSGGTLVALAAQSIRLWPHAALGPVDPQVGPFSAGALAAVVDAKPPESIDDYTLALAHESRLALSETKRLLRSMIGDNLAAMQRLVSGGIPHTYPITFEEAKGLGLKVEQVQPSNAERILVDQAIPRDGLLLP